MNPRSRPLVLVSSALVLVTVALLAACGAESTSHTSFKRSALQSQSQSQPAQHPTAVTQYHSFSATSSTPSAQTGELRLNMRTGQSASGDAYMMDRAPAEPTPMVAGLAGPPVEGRTDGSKQPPMAEATPTAASASALDEKALPSTPQPVQSNPYVNTADDNLSTFALDVDTGSYTAARNYINAGSFPPADTVRIEEFVNYFRYDYPSPEGDAFGIYVDGAPSPFGAQGSQVVRVGIQGKRVDSSQRKDAVLTFVIDVSGSMAEPNRLPLVKEALRLLVNELRPTDQVGIVTYGDEAHLVLEHTAASDSDRIIAAIDSLQNEGSTNAEAGLKLGYMQAARYLRKDAINRVILCSDGVANVGATSPDEIRKSIQGYSKQGIQLTTVGFGMGDYNDYLMEQLADDGDGNYAYVDTLSAARRIFVQNLTGVLQVIAKDAKVQVEFNPGVVARYRLLGYENRDVADINFRNDTIDAGEIGVGHSVTALYEIETTGKTGAPALTVRLRYQDPASGKVHETSRPYDLGLARKTFESASTRFQLAVVAAAFAEYLRDAGTYSASNQSQSSVDVLAITTQRIAPLLANDPDAQEFAQLVQRAVQMRGYDWRLP